MTPQALPSEHYFVQIKPNGHTLVVKAGETVLAAALRQGYIFPHSCRSAICGACKGRLLEGKVAYQDSLLFALDDAERETGYALFCSAIPQSDLIIELDGVIGPTQLPIQKLNYQVQQVHLLTTDIYQVFLAPAESSILKYQAGQYLEILHQDQSPKPFSIANAPREDGVLELHIRHQPNNPYTQEIMHEIQSIGQVRIAGPYGQNILRVDPAYPFIFLAGGTGFAPIKALIESALAQGLQQHMFLYWGVRDSRELYSQLPEQWAKFIPHFHFIPVVSANHTEQWAGRTGLVHEAVLEDYTQLVKYHIYAAGPNEMVYAALRDFTGRGLKRALLYSDLFDRP